MNLAEELLKDRVGQIGFDLEDVARGNPKVKEKAKNAKERGGGGFLDGLDRRGEIELLDYFHFMIMS